MHRHGERKDDGCPKPARSCIFLCMAPLSPLDALGPAFRRTREVLARPFHFGFFLRIAFIAALTQPSFYSASISYPMQGVQFAFLSRMPRQPAYGSQFQGNPNFAAAGLAAMLILAAVGVVVWIVATYLYCRLRFTLFDLVVYKRGRVGQAWSGYRNQSWRFFGLLILASLAFMVLAAIVVGPALLNFVRGMRPVVLSGPNGNPFQVLGAMFPFFGALLLVMVVWAVIDALMQDFLLPPMALENASLEHAFRRFFALFRAHSGTLILYVLLRFAVGLGLTYILLIALFFVLMVGGLLAFGAGMVLYHMLWISLPGQVAFVAISIVAGLVFLAIYLAAIISIYGTAAVFKQSYAVYFFGGRYTELGNRLEPPIDVATRSTPVDEVSSIPPPLPPLADAPPVW